MQENLRPFYFLDKQVKILLVDNDPGMISLLTGLFKPFILYDIQTATTAQQADKILSSPPRIHACISDLGIVDINNDEFFLLKKYGARVSFIIFTGSPSPLKGFDAHTLGAKTVIEKSSAFDNNFFFKTVNHFSLLNIINPKYRTSQDSLSISTNLLFEKSPKFVSQWAQLMGMTDRALRHIWTKHLGANTKIILSIYQIFNSAFQYFERLDSEKTLYQKEKSINSKTYIHLEEFFHMHRSTITDYIAYGNVAAIF